MLDALQSAVELACQPTNAGPIERGRAAVLSQDRGFVLANIESVAKACLNLEDYWEYRRFLELCRLLDQDLTARVASWGLHHPDADVREAANDFTEHQPRGDA